MADEKKSEQQENPTVEQTDGGSLSPTWKYDDQERAADSTKDDDEVQRIANPTEDNGGIPEGPGPYGQSNFDELPELGVQQSGDK